MGSKLSNQQDQYSIPNEKVGFTVSNQVSATKDSFCIPNNPSFIWKLSDYVIIYIFSFNIDKSMINKWFMNINLVKFSLLFSL